MPSQLLGKSAWRAGQASEDSADTPQLDDEKVYKPVLYGISYVLVFKITCQAFVVNARVKTVIDIFRGDSAAAARTMGKIFAMGSFMEFLVGPLFGQLSDIYGRKFVMQLAPMATCIANAMVLGCPNSLWVHYLRVPVIALDTSFFAAMHAMMADVMSGRNIAENGFVNMAAAGVASVVAPIIASKLSVRDRFRAATVLAGVSVLVLNCIKETLPPSRRMKPSSLKVYSCNPFAFYQLFTNGRGLATLALVSWMQTFTDARLVEEPAMFVMREKLQLSDRGAQRQLTFMAASTVNGAVVAKFSVKWLGRLGHTHASHFSRCVGYCLWSCATSQMDLMRTQFVLMFGQRQRDGVETLMTDIGIQKGMGKGQLEAYKMNWRSVSNFLAPVMYAKAFAWGKMHGFLGIPFVLAAILSALSEAVMLTVKEADLCSELGVIKVK